MSIWSLTCFDIRDIFLVYVEAMPRGYVSIWVELAMDMEFTYALISVLEFPKHILRIER